MSDNQVVIDVVTNFNTESLEQMNQYVSKARTELRSIREDISGAMDGMDAPARLLAEQLDKCISAADNVSQKTKEASKNIESGTMSDADMSSRSHILQNAFDDFKAMKNLLTGKDFYGNFSVKMAKGMFSGLPVAIQSEINSITPQLTSALHRFYNKINTGTGYNGIGQSLNSIASKAMQDSLVSGILNKTSMSAQQRDQVLKSFIPLTRPIQYSYEYQNERFGNKGITSHSAIKDAGVEGILPELYKGSYERGGYSFKTSPAGKSIKSQVLTPAAMDLLEQTISQNAVLARAAELSGVATRNKEGKLTIPGFVSRGQLGQLSDQAWNEYQTRTSGLINKIEDYYGRNAETQGLKENIQKRIIERSLNGTGSEALIGLQAVSDLLLGDNFTKRNGKSAARVIENEAKRLKEQYVVEKINPFTSDKSHDVTLAESQVTRLLGLQGHNYEKTNAIKLISMAGYDPTNPEHVRYVENLSKNGYADENGEYVLHAVHGTGEHATARLIRKQAYDAIREQYRPLAKQLGLAGDDVWNTFIPRDYEFKSAEEAGKHLDQINKMWTDAYSPGTDLSNKKFAFVDFSHMENGDKIRNSDGLGFVTKGVLSHDAQVRMGLSGKGSLVNVDFDTIGDWAKNAGLMDDKGRFMVTGIDGKQFDASGYHGLIDVSLMKNLNAYAGMTNAQANRALTGMIRAFPIGIVSDYSYDGEASGLGSQMTSFIQLSPELMKHQARAFAKRMQDLDSLEGMRRYVFNDPEHDYLSRLANDPVHGDEYLLNPQFQRRVDIYRDALVRSAAAGDFVDLDDIVDIKNERILRNPLLAYALSNGGLNEKQLTEYGQILQKAHGREFSNEEVRKLITLEGGLADFEHINSDMVAATRSPTGFGQVIARPNYAKLLAPLYKEKNLETYGIQLNNADMERLAGADMDADEVKAIVSKTNPDNIDLVKEIGTYMNYIQELEKTVPGFNLNRSVMAPVSGKNVIDNPELFKRYIEMSVKAPINMGYMSGIGSRLAQLDTMSTQAQMIARISMKGNAGYDYATTDPKKPGTTNPDSEMMRALGLGYEYQKLPAHLEDLYNVKQVERTNKDGTIDVIYTSLDEKEIIPQEDVFLTSGGRYMNLSHLRGQDGQKTDRMNLPSLFSSSAVGGLLIGKTLLRHGYSDSTITQDLLEAMGVSSSPIEDNNPLAYGDVGPAVQRIMRNKRGMLAEFAGLTRFSVSPEETKILASQYAEAMQEIEEDANKKMTESGRRGYISTNDGSFITRQDYINSRVKSAGLNQIALILGQYDKLGGQLINIGPTLENFEAKYGKEFAQVLQNPEGVHLADMTPGRFGNGFSQYSKYYVNGKSEPVFVESAPTPSGSNSNISSAASTTKKPERLITCNVCGTQYPESFGSCPNAANHDKYNNHPNDKNVPASDFNYEDFARSFMSAGNHSINAILNSENSRYAALGMRDEMKELQQSFNKEIFRDPNQTRADLWYGINRRQLQRLHDEYDYATIHGDSSIFGPETALGRELAAADANLESKYLSARGARFDYISKNNYENLIRLAENRNGVSDQQISRIDKMDELIKAQESELSNYQEDQKTRPDINPGETAKRISSISEQIEEMKEKRDTAVQTIISQNEQMFKDMGDEFEHIIDGTDKSPEYKIDKQIKKTQNELIKYGTELDEFFEKKLISEDTYNTLKNAQEQQLTQVLDGTYKKRLTDQLAAQQDAAVFRHDQRMNQLTFQNEMDDRARQHQYDQYNRQRWGHTTDRLTQYYRQGEERRFQLETEYRTNTFNANQTRAQIAQWEKDKETASGDKLTDLNNKIAEGQEKLKQYESAASSAANEMKNFGSSANIMASGVQVASEAVGRLVQRLSRQLFTKALQEAKKFVQEFDKSMTEIQMITLKSDEQISNLGQNLIQTALDSGTTVSDVTSAAANLYRQGLSDEEVNSRLDDVLKFSKVAGIKTDEASKIITTAIQNDLVSNSEEAMDALVALGDTAATTASEIAKGMQKSAASAKQAGMSYGELVTLLTIGTSKTQLGGSSIGSALQTMIYRLYKVNSGEDFFDENGNHVAATAATEALGRMGVSIFDDQGNFRGPYQILQDIAAGWEGADDITQSAILSTLGAGRQRSNVATLIQGLAADNGEIAGRYLNTAENSQGITDQKYQAYLDSLEAKINEVRTSWDQLINTFNTSDFAGGVLDTVSGFIQEITTAQEVTEGWALKIPLLVGALGALAMFIHANPIVAGLIGGVALTTGLVTGITNSINQANLRNSDSYQTQQIIERESSVISERQKDINRARELYDKAAENGGDISTLSTDEQTELSSILTRLGNNFGQASEAAKNLAGNFSNVGTELNNYQKSLDEYNVNAAKRAVSSLPITANITDLYKEYQKLGTITPETISGIESYLNTNDVQMQTFGFNVGATGPDIFKSEFAKGEPKDKRLVPILNRLLLSGDTGVPVGDIDSYYKVLASQGNDGDTARQRLYDELTSLVSSGYEKYAEDYKEYLSSIVTEYAESNLRDTLKANKVFNGLQIDEIVSTFISNVTSVLTDYDSNEIDQINLGAIVANEILKITNQIFGQEDISAGVAEYANLQTETLNKAADAAWENGNFIYSFDGTTYYNKESYDQAVRAKKIDQLIPNQIASDIIHDTANKAYWLNGVAYKTQEERLQAAKQLAQDKMHEQAVLSSDTSEQTHRLDQINSAYTDWDEAAQKLVNREGRTVVVDPVTGRVVTSAQDLSNYIRSNREQYRSYEQNAIDYLEQNGLDNHVVETQNTYGRTIYVDPVSGRNFKSKDEFKAYVLEHPSDYNAEEILAASQPTTSRVLDSISGSQMAYSDSERSKVDADNLYNEIMSKVDAADLSSILEAAEDGRLKSWDSVIKSNPEFGRLLNRFITDNGDGTYSVNDEFERGAGEFLSLLTSNSLSYSGILPEEFVSRKTRGNDVLTSLNRWMTGEAEAFNATPEDLEAIFGKQIASRVQVANQLKAGPEFLTPFELAYMQTSANNYIYGRDALTDQQRLEGATSIFNAINNGQLEMVNATPSDIIKEYASGTKELEEYINIAKEVGYAGDDWTNYEDKLRSAGKSVKQMTEMQKNVNNQLKQGKTDLAKTGDYADEYAASLEKIRKGGKSATQELGKMFSKTLSLEDQVTAAQKARGKSGKGLDSTTKDFVAQFLGVDKKDVDKMSKERISEIADSMEQAANEEFSQTNFATMLTGAFEDINTAIGENKITLDQVVDVVTTANTTGDMSGFIQLLNDIQSQYASVAEDYSGHILSYLISVVEAIGKNSGKVDVDASVQKSNATLKGGGSGGKYNKGGGGGGGKSAAQKTIDSVKHEVSQAQHEVNMAEADLYHPDKVNDYGSYTSAVQTNITANENLGSTYRKAISDLEAQRAAVKANSDDWWSLTDAINGYEEALRKLEQTIDDLNRKLFEEAKEQYTYKITGHQHEVNMNEIDREYYSRINDYGNEISTIDAEIANNNLLAEDYREAIAEYKRLQNEEYAKNGESDYWHELNQEIKDVTESLAALQNTNASLDAEKLNTVLEKQTNADKLENNAYSLMDVYSQRYLETEDYTAFQTLGEQRKQLLQDSINQNKSQVTELEGVLSQYVEGSDEWIATRDAIWAVKLDTAQKENEAIQLEKELAEQRLAQIAQTYERGSANAEHGLAMNQTFGEMYQRVSDYSGYRKELGSNIEMYGELRESATAARDAALEEMKTLTEGTPEWYNARAAVYQYDEAIASATASIQENQLAMEESLANELIEKYTDNMSLFDQQMKLLDDEMKKYENNNDYGGYMGALSNRRDILGAQTDSRIQYLDDLKNQLANTTIGTDTWKNLRKEIYSTEQAISSAQVSLENFENEMAKSRIDFFLERMDRAQSDRSHALTMIQYEETRYQNADQLSNYGIMLSKENEAREENIEALQRDILLLKQELKGLDGNEKQEQRVIDAIKKKEEAIAADNNAIEKNNKLLEENAEKINKTRTAIENQINAEIKRRKEQDKQKLSAEVNLQNQILNAIKQRFKDEWDIQKKDIDKKKEALNEEKNLINERLNARKKAMDAEDKYEDLRSLENQLALISLDPTRTKEAKELEAKISDLRKDISWDRATEEANSEAERIDDEIKSLEDWVAFSEESLNDMLEDSNNFTEEVNALLTGTYENFVNWMKENNVDFKNSLGEAQEQMLDGWDTTWKTMRGIVDTYWGEIGDIMKNKDTFISFMKESIDYISASEAGKASMMYGWTTGYDRMQDAGMVSEAAQNYEAHSHELDQVNNVAGDIERGMESAKFSYDDTWLSTGILSDEFATSYARYQADVLSLLSEGVKSLDELKDDYAGIGKKNENVAPSQSAYVEPAPSPEPAPAAETPAETAEEAVAAPAASTKTKWKLTVSWTREAGDKGTTVGTGVGNTELEAKRAAKSYAYNKLPANIVSKTDSYTKIYKSGGLVDYTGPAWVDGTKSRPEAFLSAIDTENIRNLLDAFSYISVGSHIHPDPGMFASSSQTYGDINIVINQAELKDDADYDTVARKVGQAITKQISKQGINLTGYAF